MTQAGFQERLQHFESLFDMVRSSSSPSVRANVEELIQILLELHGTGLERLLEIVWDSGEAGEQIIQQALVDDSLVSSLLLLHDLHPLTAEDRVLRALDKVRPYLGSHGGDVELLGVTSDGVVRLRMEGSCHGCPSSAITLKFAIEKAIYEASPDVTAIQVEGEETPAPPAAGFIPLTSLAISDEPGWIAIDAVAQLGEDEVQAVSVTDQMVLICRADGTRYAYANHCPHCGAALAQAKLTGATLICPVCSYRYEVKHAGRCTDDLALYLQPYPLLEAQGQWRVALPELSH